MSVCLVQVQRFNTPKEVGEGVGQRVACKGKEKEGTRKPVTVSTVTLERDRIEKKRNKEWWPPQVALGRLRAPSCPALGPGADGGAAGEGRPAPTPAPRGRPSPGAARLTPWPAPAAPAVGPAPEAAPGPRGTVPAEEPPTAERGVAAPAPAPAMGGRGTSAGASPSSPSPIPSSTAPAATAVSTSRADTRFTGFPISMLRACS